MSVSTQVTWGTLKGVNIQILIVKDLLKGSVTRLEDRKLRDSSPATEPDAPTSR